MLHRSISNKFPNVNIRPIAWYQKSLWRIQNDESKHIRTNILKPQLEAWTQLQRRSITTISTSAKLMGASSSRRVFIEIITQLQDKDIDSSENDFWDEMWKTSLSVEVVDIMSFSSNSFF